jgi:hypothetical protein
MSTPASTLAAMSLRGLRSLFSGTTTWASSELPALQGAPDLVLLNRAIKWLSVARTKFAAQSQTDLVQPGAALCASNSLILLDYFESVETSDGPHMQGVPGSSPGASTNFLDRIKCAENMAGRDRRTLRSLFPPPSRAVR